MDKRKCIAMVMVLALLLLEIMIYEKQRLKRKIIVRCNPAIYNALLIKNEKMKKVTIIYRIKPDKVAENERLVEDVYHQLHEANIEGFHYTTFRLADGVSFIHIAFADSERANTAFANLPAFKKFQAGIKERCDELPVVTPLIILGAYNFQIESHITHH